jgi:hypothetical protein
VTTERKHDKKHEHKPDAKHRFDEKKGEKFDEKKGEKKPEEAQKFEKPDAPTQKVPPEVRGDSTPVNAEDWIAQKHADERAEGETIGEEKKPFDARKAPARPHPEKREERAKE